MDAKTPSAFRQQLVEIDPKTGKRKEIDWSVVDVDIARKGKHIILPADPGEMSLDAGIAALKRQKELENQRYDVNEFVMGAPWDALVALNKAMKDIYGVVMAQSIQTFFGEIKPELVTVKTGPLDTDNIQVVSGQMSLPNIENPVMVGLHRKGAYIQGTVRRKDKGILVEIVNRARDIMKTDSIYKGKAIVLHVDADGDLMLNTQPDFMELQFDEPDMIHTHDTMQAIQANIFGPLKHTAACRKHQIPLKRGVLLYGQYGCGKSLTASVTAKVATDNHWTFLNLSRAQGLKAAIEFAQTYQPCVIFAEDIDRAGADRENDEAVNDLVNTLDGTLTKSMEVEVVLTTNFVKKIDVALLRPGRFDALIEIEPPDASTAVRLINLYSRGLIGEKEDLTEIGEILNGQIPATIREVVERSKITMLMEDRTLLTADDLKIAAKQMVKHSNMLKPPVEEKTNAEKFYEAFGGLVADFAGIDPEVSEGLQNDMRKVTSGNRDLVRFVNEKMNNILEATKGAAGSADSANQTAKLVRDLVSSVKQTGEQDLATTQKVLKAVG